jgi:ABC-type glycerol-3-phosphate transport system permease component
MNWFAIPFYIALLGSFIIGVIASYIASRFKIPEKATSIISYFIAFFSALPVIYTHISFNSRMRSFNLFPSHDFSLFDLNPTIIGLIGVFICLAGWKSLLIFQKMKRQKQTSEG